MMVAGILVFIIIVIAILSKIYTPPMSNYELGDTWTRPTDGMVMVYVPAGEFQMGSNDQEDIEKPVHPVALDAFWIDRTEVTNAQYQKCIAAGACAVSVLKNDSTFNGATQPVVGVAWQDAVTYCKWAGGRLPTEAEWEYAARGPGGFTYPWGDTFDGARVNFCDKNCLDDDADKSVNDGYAVTAPVGSYPEGASWVGALDMAGNVWEWGADWFDDYPSTYQSNPTGPVTGYGRVLRGGSWLSGDGIVRSDERGGSEPAHRDQVVGFRCVRGNRQGE